MLSMLNISILIVSMKLIVLVFLLFYSIAFSVANKNHETCCEKVGIHSGGDLGSIKYAIEKSAWTRREFFSFRDVKYAEVPTGRSKFKPASIITQFNSPLYDATSYRQPCISTFEENNLIDADDDDILDCLFLSIHTPKLDGNLSVLVYLTGFDLLQGSNAESNPGYFMEHDIVFVTVQYRLGILGFLNADSRKIAGNAAIFDILTALKWIRKFIGFFGGNPKSVTLFGQYKVAGIIHSLTMMSEAKGLFHKIICQSGSVFTENLLTWTSAELSRQIGIKLGCPILFNTKKLSDCISRASISDLNAIFRNYLRNHNGQIGLVTVGGLDGLLQYMPHEMKRRERIGVYPMIIGVVENPSTYLIDAHFNDHLSIFSLNRTNLIDGLGLNQEEYKQFLRKRILEEDMKIRKTIKSAIDLSEYSRRYVYLFRYRNNGMHYLKRKPGNPLEDVTLADDNVYLFPSRQFLLKDEDVLVARQMVDLWVSFAVRGSPSTMRRTMMTDVEDVVEWPLYEADSKKYLSIDRSLELDSNLWIYIEPNIN